MISTSTSKSIPLPLENGDAELQEAPSEASILSFFVVSAKLYEIAQRILVSLYSDGGPSQEPGYERYFIGPLSVFQLDDSLRTWRGNLPEHLRLGQARHLTRTKESTYRRQAVVLWLRCVPRQRI